MNSAILFLVFNRPDLASQVFQAIRSARPPRLYVAADGPREGRDSERQDCMEARRVIDEVDWPCEVKCLFQEKNLGPMHAQVAALDWFFDQEKEGVILEDDCLPDQSFFGYCDELLECYRDDRRVFMISGNNFQGGIKRGDADYYFSIYTHIWGWAAWKRSWQCFDKDLTDWPSFRECGGLENLHGTKVTRKYWFDLFDRIYSGTYKRGWDYRFLFACWRENGLTIIPQKNLVTNIGFGHQATNCKDLHSPFSNVNTYRINLPLRHPKVISRCFFADEKTSGEMFSYQSLLVRAMAYLIRPRLLLGKLLKKIKGVVVV